MSRASTLGFPILLIALAAPARAADVALTLGAGDGFAVKNNTGTTDRLRVDEATGNVSRNGALFVHTTGTENLFVGPGAGSTGTTGLGGNAAFGINALAANTTGRFNSAFGLYALVSNTTGARNLALGYEAGSAQTTGSNNIYLANLGVTVESDQIKIGTLGTHTRATIAGIHGTTSAGGIAVLVNASGVLGTTTSSIQFKENVRDMGDASDVLMRLRPVKFHYKKEVAPDSTGELQFGLIAEEVAKVAPELVAPDLEGRPYSVKYHVLPALLLDQVQKDHRTIEGLRAQVEALTHRLATRETRQ